MSTKPLVAFHGEGEKRRIGRPPSDWRGRRIGRMTVLSLVRRNIHGLALWQCQCECGAIRTAWHSELTRGRPMSCVCSQRETRSAAAATHHMTGSPEYRSWLAMRQRCAFPSHVHFKDYGGRGITWCHRWDRFEAFYEDMGPRPSLRHSLDRIDNSLGYSKDNCRWATRVQQMNNTRSSRVVAYKGRSQTVMEWSREAGLPYGTLYARIHRFGWTPTRALESPIRRAAQ